MLYVFDMDGTLTPARKPMTEAFSAFFLAWQQTHMAFIATGSDYRKVQEQLPQAVIDSFSGVYCSMGNVLVSKGAIIYENQFEPPEGLLELLREFREKTEYPGTLYDNFIEMRPGMINFSVLGRNCPFEARYEYSAWDAKSRERYACRDRIQEKYPDLEVSVGGSISIDITPHGCGKGQIARHIRKSYPEETIVFFGDRTFAGGNDFELAQALRGMPQTQVVQVEGPESVMAFLQQH